MKTNAGLTPKRWLPRTALRDDLDVSPSLFDEWGSNQAPHSSFATRVSSESATLPKPNSQRPSTRTQGRG